MLLFLTNWGIWMQQKNGSVGIIYGDVGSTEFNFTVDGHNLRKFDYVTAPHKEGYILAQVMDIKRYSDLKFQDAVTMKSDEELKSLSYTAHNSVRIAICPDIDPSNTVEDLIIAKIDGPFLL